MISRTSASKLLVSTADFVVFCQTVSRLRDELAEEKATMLDTVLTQLGELTHRQVQQAKHDNRVSSSSFI